MKQTTHIIFAIVLSAALLLPNLGLGVTGNAADSRTHRFVMVAPEGETKLSGLGIRPFNVPGFTQVVETASGLTQTVYSPLLL